MNKCPYGKICNVIGGESKLSCAAGAKSEADCRYWIKYPKEGNCCLRSIDINGSMSLRDVGEREGLSYVRIMQIEEKLLKSPKLRRIVVSLLE